MSGRKPRVQVALEQKTNDLLFQISEITGKSKSALISEVFESAVPGLEKLLNLLKRTEELDEEMKGKVLAELANSEEQLLGALQTVEQIDFFGGK